MVIFSYFATCTIVVGFEYQIHIHIFKTILEREFEYIQISGGWRVILLNFGIYTLNSYGFDRNALFVAYNTFFYSKLLETGEISSN